MTGNENKNSHDSNLPLLKELVDENLSTHLNELVLSFMIMTGKCAHQRSARKFAVEDLSCTLKVLARAARECCEKTK